MDAFTSFIRTSGYNDSNYLQRLEQYTMPEETPENLTRKEMPKKALYSTTEIAETLEMAVSTIRMAKAAGDINEDTEMSTPRYTWYTADEVQRFANSRGFYIVFITVS